MLDMLEAAALAVSASIPASAATAPGVASTAAAPSPSARPRLQSARAAAVAAARRARLSATISTRARAARESAATTRAGATAAMAAKTSAATSRAFANPLGEVKRRFRFSFRIRLRLGRVVDVVVVSLERARAFEPVRTGTRTAGEAPCHRERYAFRASRPWSCHENPRTPSSLEPSRGEVRSPPRARSNERFAVQEPGQRADDAARAGQRRHPFRPACRDVHHDRQRGCGGERVVLRRRRRLRGLDAPRSRRERSRRVRGSSRGENILAGDDAPPTPAPSTRAQSRRPSAAARTTSEHARACTASWLRKPSRVRSFLVPPKPRSKRSISIARRNARADAAVSLESSGFSPAPGPETTTRSRREAPRRAARCARRCAARAPPRDGGSRRDCLPAGAAASPTASAASARG